jgi:hypothetical protein
MQRLKDYLNFAAWQTGLGYIALWALTFWTLDHGADVFGRSGLCRPDEAKVLFHWVCDPAHPLAVLAAAANMALTVTVWAPVYVAAATVRPEAVALALPIVGAHALGLPAAIFVMMRLLLIALHLPRSLLPARAAAERAVSCRVRPARPRVRPRSTFGLRRAPGR